MITVVYANAATGQATNLMSGPDLAAFPEPTTDQVALLVAADSEMPGWIDSGTYHRQPSRPGHGFEWDSASRAWLASMPALERYRSVAYQAIDRAAGAARLRYITSVPGQAETYTRKEEQARAWAATGFSGQAPSFIAAEAAALQVPARQVAEEVIALADFWAQVKGPEIEAARIVGKARVRAALDEATIAAAQAAAEVALAAL